MLHVVPLSFAAAKAFVNEHHSHHSSAHRWKFGCGVADAEDNLVGVVMVGRPVNRIMDDGYTLEVLRCCTLRTHNAASMLYGIARRVSRELGYTRLITYTLAEEDGHSLRVAGFVVAETVDGRSWNTSHRPRADKHPLGDKVRWVMNL